MRSWHSTTHLPKLMLPFREISPIPPQYPDRSFYGYMMRAGQKLPSKHYPVDPAPIPFLCLLVIHTTSRHSPMETKTESLIPKSGSPTLTLATGTEPGMTFFRSMVINPMFISHCPTKLTRTMMGILFGRKHSSEQVILTQVLSL